MLQWLIRPSPERLAASTGGMRTWYGTDGQGSVRQTLDDSGAVLGMQSYDPYGQPETGSTLVSSFGYTGELQNSTTGAEYLRARWYQPGTGQLLGVDPLVASTGQPYSYANDNPVNGSDPSGQCTLGTVNLVGLENGNGDCNHYIDQQLHQQSATAPLIQQDEVAVNAAIDQVLGDVSASQDQAAVLAAVNSPAGYGEYEVLNGGQLSADQQQQLGQTDLHDLAAFQARLNDPGAVEQAAVDAPSTGKAGFFLGLCLGAFNLAKKVDVRVALGFLVLAGAVYIAIRVLNPQPKPRPTPQPATPTPPAPTATTSPPPGELVYHYTSEKNAAAIYSERSMIASKKFKAPNFTYPSGLYGSIIPPLPNGMTQRDLSAHFFGGNRNVDVSWWVSFSSAQDPFIPTGSPSRPDFRYRPAPEFARVEVHPLAFGANGMPK